MVWGRRWGLGLGVSFRVCVSVMMMTMVYVFDDCCPREIDAMRYYCNPDPAVFVVQYVLSVSCGG